jgi:hypothetical protein
MKVKVIIHLKTQSQPIIYERVVNTYQKGDLFCLYLESEKTIKFPIQNIFRIEEDYGYHGER